MLTGDKFMLQLHLKQPGFTKSACGLFTRHHERIQKFTETGNLKHLYRNELDKVCFPHDVASSDSKDLAKRSTSDKILKDRADESARSPKFDGYQSTLVSTANNFFDRKTGSGVSVNEQVAEELLQPVI